MALVNCSECGREISTKAAACPGCGAPGNAGPAAPTARDSVNSTNQRPDDSFGPDRLDFAAPSPKVQPSPAEARQTVVEEELAVAPVRLTLEQVARMPAHLRTTEQQKQLARGIKTRKAVINIVGLVFLGVIAFVIYGI